MDYDELLNSNNTYMNDSERDIVQNLINEMFPAMQKYIDDQVNEIKNRLKAEKLYHVNDNEIAITVSSVNRLYEIEDLFRPIIDVDARGIDCECKDGKVYFKIFLKESLRDMASLPGKVFNGTIFTSNGDFHTEFTCVPNDDYLKYVKRIEKAYALNGLHWQPVDTAYLKRFFFLVTDLNSLGDDTENIKITGCKLDAECELHFEVGLCPVWNLWHSVYHVQSFPMLMENGVTYRYDMELDDGSDMVINLNENEDGYCVHYDNVVSYFSKSADITELEGWMLKRAAYETDAYDDYMICTNGIKSNVLACRKGTGGFSMFDLSCKVMLLKESDYFTYSGAELLNNQSIYTEDYICSSEYASKERVSGDILVLKFYNKSAEEWLKEDILRFIADVVSVDFPRFIVACLIL